MIAFPCDVCDGWHPRPPCRTCQDSGFIMVDPETFDVKAYAMELLANRINREHWRSFFFGTDSDASSSDPLPGVR